MMEEKTKPKQKKRHRSPPHPYFGLRECVDFVTKLYEEDGLQRVHVDVAVKHMGLELSSSVGMRALAALRGFGLLDEVGTKTEKEIWLSPIAKSIVLEKQQFSQERIRALREAACNYTIIQELAQKWNTQLPSNAAIETVLLRDKGFTPRGASHFVKVFRDTYRYARFAESTIMPSGEGVLPERDHAKSDSEVKMPGGLPSIEASYDRLKDVISLGGGDQIIVDRPKSLSRKKYEIFVKYIELMKSAWVAEEWAEDPDGDGHAT